MHALLEITRVEWITNAVVGITYIDICIYVNVNPFSDANRNIPGKLGQYYRCWCPGFLCRQDINSSDIHVHVFIGHYSGAKWEWRRLKSPAPRLFIQWFAGADIKENIKHPQRWSFVRGNNRSLPPHKGPVTRKVCSWRHRRSEFQQPATRNDVKIQTYFYVLSEKFSTTRVTYILDWPLNLCTGATQHDIHINGSQNYNEICVLCI